MDVGIKLTRFRELKKISKNKLAKEVGVTQGFISQVELGNRQPTLEVLNRICSALGITLAEFFADQAPEMPPDVRRVCDKVQKLTPDKLKILESVLDTWVEND
ncbi:MAG: helix-turn-helix domain-containing protein [Firmicutes bacterium]|nr:helix-turn-helix domain-containing protein [Bacillota bacterium]